MTALSPLTRPAISATITDGCLEFGEVAIRRDYVASVDVGVHRLLLGEVVWIQQYGPVVTAIQRTVRMVLARGQAT